MAGSAIRSEGGPPDWLGKAAPRKPAGALQLPEAPGEFSIAACSGVDDGLIEPHPSQRAALPSFAHFKVASHAPLILTGDPRLPSQVVNSSTDPAVHVPLDTFVPLDTETFAGRLLLTVRAGHTMPSPDRLGIGKWLGKIVIQGKFKAPMPAQDLWVGQELWNKPLLAPSFQKLVFSSAAKFFSSTSRVATEGDGVGFLNPVLAMAHVINVSPPGSEPELDDIREDMRLMSSSLADKKGNPLPASLRQRHFDRPANLARAGCIDDVNVWTFVICQSILDLPQYKLALGGWLNLDLCQLLNGQPLQLLCKDVRANKPLISLLMWHEKLNYPDGYTSRSPGSSSSSLYHASSSRCSDASSDVCSLGSSNLSSMDSSMGLSSMGSSAISSVPSVGLSSMGSSMGLSSMGSSAISSVPSVGLSSMGSSMGLSSMGSSVVGSSMDSPTPSPSGSARASSSEHCCFGDDDACSTGSGDGGSTVYGSACSEIWEDESAPPSSMWPPAAKPHVVAAGAQQAALLAAPAGGRALPGARKLLARAKAVWKQVKRGRRASAA